MKNLILISYSGHSFVSIEVAICMGFKILGYCDVAIKDNNPYNLQYFGMEMERKNLELILENDYFVGIGNNHKRYNISDKIFNHIEKNPLTLIHPNSLISATSSINDFGVLIMPNSTINALASIGRGSIINTGAIVEHECKVGSFCHIAPGVTLLGRVKVGDYSFIGANSVVKEGISIGNNCIIGAGTVVLCDVPSGVTMVGNPGKIIKKN
jgi:sugar O-acyltransferase (sialic acid O-acetyltransferase NeuD family)